MSYAIAWFLPIVLFWLLLREAPMLFFLIVYTWYPILAGVVCFKIVSKNRFRVWNFGAPIICGLVNMSVFYLTYGITNHLSMSNVAWSNRDNFLMNAVAAAVGIMIGTLSAYVKSLRQN